MENLRIPHRLSLPGRVEEPTEWDRRGHAMTDREILERHQEFLERVLDGLDRLLGPVQRVLGAGRRVQSFRSIVRRLGCHLQVTVQRLEEADPSLDSIGRTNVVHRLRALFNEVYLCDRALEGSLACTHSRGWRPQIQELCQDVEWHLDLLVESRYLADGHAWVFGLDSD